MLRLARLLKDEDRSVRSAAEEALESIEDGRIPIRPDLGERTGETQRALR